MLLPNEATSFIILLPKPFEYKSFAYKSDNQKQVFAYIAVQTPDDQKKILQDNIEAINALLKRLQ